MHWLYLALAIVFEVGGTTCMKLSEGLTKPIFAIVFEVGGTTCMKLSEGRR